MTNDPNKPVSREAALPYAHHDPVLRDMIAKGIPLTREAYLDMAWGNDRPEEWTAEHEIDVPAVFRDPDAIQPTPGKRGSLNLQD